MQVEQISVDKLLCNVESDESLDYSHGSVWSGLGIRKLRTTVATDEALLIKISLGPAV